MAAPRAAAASWAGVLTAPGGQLQDDIGVAERGRRGEGRAAIYVDGRPVRDVAEEQRHDPRVSLEGGQL